MNLISIDCPKCAASLKIPPGTETATCEYCGSSFRMPSEASPSAPDMVVEGRPFRIEGDGTRQVIVFPEDTKSATTFNRIAAGVFIFCALITILFIIEPYRWAGPFGGAIIMFILGIISLISGYYAKNTRWELSLAPERMKFVKLIAGQERSQTVIATDAYKGCETIKEREGRGGPRYKLRIKGDDGDIILGAKHLLDQDDVPVLRGTVEKHMGK